MTNAALSDGLAASSLEAWAFVSLSLITVEYFKCAQMGYQQSLQKPSAGFAGNGIRRF